VKPVTNIEHSEELCEDYIECYEQFLKLINVIQGTGGELYK